MSRGLRIRRGCTKNLRFCFINLSQQLSLREYGAPSRGDSAEQRYLRDLHVLLRRGGVLLGKMSASEDRMQKDQHRGDVLRENRLWYEKFCTIFLFFLKRSLFDKRTQFFSHLLVSVWQSSALRFSERINYMGLIFILIFILGNEIKSVKERIL